MITSRILGNSRGLVFGLIVGGWLRFDDDCMWLNWGSELMMIRIRIARRSRGLVLGCWLEEHLNFTMVVCQWIPLCNVVLMQQMNNIELAVLWNGAGKYSHTNLCFCIGINISYSMLIMIVLQKMMLLATQTICLKDSHTNFQINVGISILYFWGTLQFVCKKLALEISNLSV